MGDLGDLGVHERDSVTEVKSMLPASGGQNLPWGSNINLTGQRMIEGIIFKGFDLVMQLK